ncbi:hypothetical protein CERZMDRAFT_85389 [Cercospora zeae-maydis SCOH1-5]|uniref:Uncharacterized protein n=1 Tax=Cercospora zeae-maydis SCOH1-5 TaxID=717836 RepID=A0A6A6FDW0_9PEZI|nr:hypothetical protein CERZMDRAFT_85389 [Cercospora zeae-maydis SCOH1-5]
MCCGMTNAIERWCRGHHTWIQQPLSRNVLDDIVTAPVTTPKLIDSAIPKPVQCISTRFRGLQQIAVESKGVSTLAGRGRPSIGSRRTVTTSKAAAAGSFA